VETDSEDACPLDTFSVETVRLEAKEDVALNEDTYAVESHASCPYCEVVLRVVTPRVPNRVVPVTLRLFVVMVEPANDEIAAFSAVSVEAKLERLEK